MLTSSEALLMADSYHVPTSSYQPSQHFTLLPSFNFYKFGKQYLPFPITSADAQAWTYKSDPPHAPWAKTLPAKPNEGHALSFNIQGSSLMSTSLQGLAIIVAAVSRLGRDSLLALSQGLRASFIGLRCVSNHLQY